MKKQTLIFLFVFALSFSVSAQQSVDKKIENIRKIYTEISQNISATEKTEESGRTSEIAVNELVVNKLNKSWAAVGNYKVVYRFYYQNQDEEPYPTQLVKVTRSTESAARKYFEEFVYDENDKLIFYFEKSEDGEAPLERRIYFQNEKPIRLVEDKNSNDKISVKNEAVSKVLKENNKIKQIFINSID